MNDAEFLVLGAGAAGCGIANFLRDRGRKVLILEQHFAPGGSAGYFSRGKFTFDAGATTLSGLSPGRPLRTFSEKTKINFQARKIEPGLEISLPGGRLTSSEFESFFPHAFWEKVKTKSSLCWELTQSSADWPPHDGASFLRLLLTRVPAKLSALPLLTTSFADAFQTRDLTADQQRLIDELLLISTQSTAAQAPALMGVMGLTYPEDTWYPEGGMKGFFHSLTLPLGESLRLRQEVTGIEEASGKILVKTPKGVFSCRTLISTLPRWNTMALLGRTDSRTQHFQDLAWGALTGYYKVRLGRERMLYHQLHCAPLSYGGSLSIFLSLCPKDDLARCDGVFQTLSVSTHIRVADYQRAIANGRLEARAIWDQEFQARIQLAYGEDLLELVPVGLGDPDTFFRFTKRAQGLVGGIPHTLSSTVFSYPQAKLARNVYQIGDTSFPGQGIVGVIQGALNLSERL